MANRTRGRSKIETLGLSEEAIRLKGEGMGSIRMSRALSAMSGEKINATNIDNFFNSLKAITQDNKELIKSLSSSVDEVNGKVLSNWDKIDKEIMKLLDEVKEEQEKCIGIDKKTNEPIIIKVKDRRLLKDVIVEIAKISEIRLRTLGQIQSGNNHITFNFIENQYNELQQIVLSAEGEFPGLNKWIEQAQYKKSGKD